MAEDDLPIVGIDVGATSSRIAVWTDGKVTVLRNELGEDKGTPTAVSFGDERLIGTEAEKHLQDLPKDVVFAKRLLGRSWADPFIQEADHRLWSFTIIRSSWGKPLILVRYKGEERTYVPEEIISLVLKHLVATAEKQLMGRRITQAVVTVPASFTLAQREAMQVATTWAGIRVLRLIDEPTSAALAVYGLDRPHMPLTSVKSSAQLAGMGADQQQAAPQTDSADGGESSADGGGGELTVLVFNLGGGTCDASLISLDAGILEVKATAGSTRLGGEAFDIRLTYLLADEFQRQQMPMVRDVLSFPVAVQRLKAAAEAAKIALSSQTTTRVVIPDLLPGAKLDVTVTRKQFEAACEDLFTLCIDTAKAVLEEGNLDASKLHEVVLVGGCAHIPRLQTAFKAALGKAPTIAKEKDSAARGAAVQAAIMLGKAGPALDDVLVLRVLASSLGIRQISGQVAFLLPRNATIPTKREITLCTTVENQPVALIEVYEGESAAARENAVVASITLPLVPAPFGSPNIQVVFDVDADGLLRVSATDKASGHSRQATAWGFNLYGTPTGVSDNTMGGGE